MKLSCAVVEDDNISRLYLEGLIERTNLLQVEASFDTATAAIPWLTTTTVDFLFVDVEMPGMSGLDMLQLLPYKPQVIVVSGNPTYAVNAFNLSLTDYLVKPLNDFPRFLQAVNKGMSQRKTDASKSGDDAIFVKIDSLLTKIDVGSILWIEAFGDYVKIQTETTQHVVYSTLKKLLDRIDPEVFVRVHRSFVVNVREITNIDPGNLEINKKIIPISATYKEELYARISIL